MPPLLELKLLSDEARFNANWTGRLQVYSDGALVTPSEVTLAVYNTSGDTIIEPDNDLDDDGTILFYLTAKQIGFDGAMTCDWYVSAEIEVGSTYTLFGTARFYVVRTPLVCNVVDADLDAIHPGILLQRVPGQTTWTKQIAQAFDDVHQDIRAKGYAPDQMIDGAQVKRLVVMRALYLIYNACALNPGDQWFIRAASAADQYQAEFDTHRYYFNQSSDGKTTAQKIFGRTIRFIR